MTEEKVPHIRTRIPVKGSNRPMIERSIFSYFRNEPDVMTVHQTAAALHCSKNTVYDLIKKGRIETMRVGRRILIPKSNLVEFLMSEKNYQIINPYPPKKVWTSEKSCDTVCRTKNKSKGA